MTVPPRAAAFIVTIYGDVVEPRGGVLWMGNLIEICATVGLSESVVRTAVSRLVAAGQLQGERVGRRSYYRLTEPAQREYGAAARLFYGAPPRPADWCIAQISQQGHATRGTPPLETADHGAADQRSGNRNTPPQGFASLGAGLWLGPASQGAPPAAGAVFTARGLAGPGLRSLAARCWDLKAVAQGFRDVTTAWNRCPAERDGARALARRLSLVHDFRRAVLADPRLPAEALPTDWPEAGARAAFARAYLALTEPADAWIADHCRASQGPLPRSTAATADRLDRLRERIP